MFLGELGSDNRRGRCGSPAVVTMIGGITRLKREAIRHFGALSLEFWQPSVCMDYLEWNDLIVDYFFSPEMADR